MWPAQGTPFGEKDVSKRAHDHGSHWPHYVLYPLDAAHWESIGMAVEGTPPTPAWMWHQDLGCGVYTKSKIAVWDSTGRNSGPWSQCHTEYIDHSVPSSWVMLPPAGNWVGGRVQSWANLLQCKTSNGQPVFQGPLSTSFSDLSPSPKFFPIFPSSFPFSLHRYLTYIPPWISMHLHLLPLPLSGIYQS